MDEQIDLEEDWTPDKYRDDLCRRRWKESGAKTREEFWKWIEARERKLTEDAEAAGLSIVDYIIAQKTAQELAQTNA
jgi:TRAP-type C4-dicarboxylate transport system substrate-binding protein